MAHIEEVLARLDDKRPIFHNEADFQHALASELHEKYPAFSVRLEYRPPHVSKRMYTDIWLDCGDGQIAIELKYKTRSLKTEVNGEVFELLNQGAQDLGNYDLRRDVERLEQVVDDRTNIVGYAVLLTNDSYYWTPRTSETISASFRVGEGQQITGAAAWGVGASRGTMRGRESAVTISGTYQAAWQDYSVVDGSKAGRSFRYLLISAWGVEQPSNHTPGTDQI